MADTTTPAQRELMERAVAEARRCRPANKHDPYVGALAVDSDGKVLGSAFRGEMGPKDHAEFTLLEKKLKNDVLAGATVYTTLEPCTVRNSEHKTPCAEWLRQRQVSRVFIGMLDPNKNISGDGVRYLQKHGIVVEDFDEDLRKQLEELNRDFTDHFERMQRDKKAEAIPDKKDENLNEMQPPNAPTTVAEVIRIATEEKTAIRAYLQRAEVRLSTMHRIGGSFLSGAGLLVLLPVLLRESLGVIADTVKGFALKPDLSTEFLFSVIAAAVVFGIPLWSLWLLLQDLTLFYFTANVPPGKQPALPPGTRPEGKKIFHPRFALTAIPFADDEGEGVKRKLRELQFNTHLINFLLSANAKDRQWLEAMAGSDDGKKIALPEDEWLVGCYKDDQAAALRMSFGLAGAYNRDLVDEAAKLELSLIRHNLHLRRLVLRYMKAMLILLFTAFMSYLYGSLVNGLPAENRLVPGAVMLWLWACLVQVLVRVPILWIRREYDLSSMDETRDRHLRQFEQWVVGICGAMAIAAAVACWSLESSRWPMPSWALIVVAVFMSMASVYTYLLKPLLSRG